MCNNFWYSFTIFKNVSTETLYFDDFQIGNSFQSAARTITETDIVNFACLSGDFNPIHVDVEHAKGGAFGERIAHGLLGLAILSGLLHELGVIRKSVVAFVHLDWKFKQVVKIGDTIAGKFEVTRNRAMGKNQGLVSFQATVTNQKQEVVAEGLWELIIRKK